MSSPPVSLERVCADGRGRLRFIRARRLLAGILVLAVSLIFFGLAGAARAQFPIRQMPPRTHGGAPTRPVAEERHSPAANALPTAPLPAVARIVVPEKDGISFGSGTLVDARGQFGLVVSNWHVVRDAAGPITVEFPDGFRSPAQVVKTDKDWDLAALSIYRPAASPVPVSNDAPQPGQPLSIAGYGSGQWRMAAGRCTQYLAPGVDFPHELVELSAEARQGDSGGPILNERGEIAGVLFGSGPGYTSGSYGGRVLKFLASVVPGGAPGSDGIAPPQNSLAANAPVSPPPAIHSLATSPPPITPPPQATALHAHQPPPAPHDAQPYGAPPPASASAMMTPAPLTPALQPTNDAILAPPPPREFADRFGAGGDIGSEDVNPRVAVNPSRLAPAVPPLESPASLSVEPPAAALNAQLPPRVSVPAPSADLAHAPPEKLLAALWRRFGGSTAFDQAKSVLAIVGFLSLVVVFLRFGSHKEPEHHEE